MPMGRLCLSGLAVLLAGAGLRGACFLFFALALNLSQASGAGRAIRVSLTLHAGEEDPHWLVNNPEQIKLIQHRLRNLPPAAQPAWPVLGWRGFHLRGPGLPGSVQVFKGVICVIDDHEERCYVDQHRLEGWLDAEARRQGLGRFIPQANQK